MSGRVSTGRPCRVGLTGGLASGKSTVARILGTWGIPVLDADTVVHRLYQADEPGAAAVRALFGPTVMDAGGAVDRVALGRLVLADGDARNRLESAVHPLVRQAIQGWLDDRSGLGLAVVEAALLVETGSSRDYDVLLVVWCEVEQQLCRAVARGVPEDRARAILAAQRPLHEKRDLADVAIDNRGDLEDLLAQVERRWSEVVERCRRRLGDRAQTAGGSSHSVR